MNASRNVDRFVAVLIVLIVPALLTAAWLRNFSQANGEHGHGGMSETGGSGAEGTEPAGHADMPGDDHGAARPAPAGTASSGSATASGSAAGSGTGAAGSMTPPPTSTAAGSGTGAGSAKATKPKPHSSSHQH